MKAEPSDNDTLAPPRLTLEGDVQQELQAPKEEEETWDEEEETLVEVGARPCCFTKIKLRCMVDPREFKKSAPCLRSSPCEGRPGRGQGEERTPGMISVCRRVQPMW